MRIDRKIPRTLIGDEQRLAQVITNLLSNAVKFTPENGVINLDAYFVNEMDGVCELKIKVSDSGIGITPEQQERLFRSFEQAESSTSRKYGGTGLGLAISKNIVELMGGKIWVNSVAGKGSTFAFTIQAQRGAGATQKQFDVELNRANLRLLVVDDSPDVREYFSEILKQFNIKFDVASCGQEACDLIRSNGTYDMYFVDWKMPGMNGIELTGHIRESDGDKSVVIMISSGEWDAISDEAKRAGVDKFLPKPLFPSMIADCISDCLGLAEHQAAVNAAEDDLSDCFEGHCILLAEDVEINREIVITLLEPTKLEIDCAENGLEAVEMFKNNPDKYDMIFMDVQMPEMDGYEATKRIRAMTIERAREIPIVAMTANVFREDIEKCIMSGMNDHLGKPLNIDEVISRLKIYLG